MKPRLPKPARDRLSQGAVHRDRSKYARVDDDDLAEQAEWEPRLEPCPMCGGGNRPEGMLGSRYQHRCRACGIWYSSR